MSPTLFRFWDISTLTSHILLVNGWGWKEAPGPPMSGSASVCDGGPLRWRTGIGTPQKTNLYTLQTMVYHTHDGRSYSLHCCPFGHVGLHPWCYTHYTTADMVLEISSTRNRSNCAEANTNAVTWLHERRPPDHKYAQIVTDKWRRFVQRRIISR